MATNNNTNSSDSGGGFSCISFLVFLFFMWALWFGLPTFWGVLEIDFFGPAIRLDGITYLGN